MNRRDFLKALPIVLAGPILARAPVAPAAANAREREEIILAVPDGWTPDNTMDFAEAWRDHMGGDSHFIVTFVPHGMTRVDQPEPAGLTDKDISALYDASFV